MPQLARLRLNSKILVNLLVFVVFLMYLSPIFTVKAINNWQDDNENTKTSIVAKPVDPVYINVGGNPIYVPNYSLPIDIGDSWSLEYYLEKFKRYHIFLVGDWICNETDPLTDYDILTYYPDGSDPWWNTESAGIPEQVAFDEHHQYFVPPETGTYRFEIINDERDSSGTESAIFMVIENIDLNTEYSKYLKGRSDSEGSFLEEVVETSWAYEFNTKAPKIRVFVDVPDRIHEPERGHLDMYEVRLYAMANPESDVGYLVDGIGLPSGNLFNNFQGEYGGYNASTHGDRNMDAMSSCEYHGADMEFTYETPNGVNGTNDIFYYLVLVAEHDEGTVNFYIQTDFVPPSIDLIDPPSIGIAGEKTRISAEVEDEYDVDIVWVQYTTDGKSYGEVGLSKSENLWIGELPGFNVRDEVNYTLYASDQFGNTNYVESNLTIKERVMIQSSLVDNTLRTGQLAELHGTSSLSSEIHEIVFNNGDYTERINITTTSEGEFSYTYNAKQPGSWSVQILYHGDDLRVPSGSEPLLFTKYPVTLECDLYEISIRGTQKAEIRGTSTLNSAPIELEFKNGNMIKTYDLTTDESGGFTCTFSPNKLGVWSVRALFNEDEYEAAASSEPVTFNYESLQTHISALLNPASVKIGKPITISGSVAPQVNGLPVELLIVSPITSYTETVYTDLRGSFSYTFNPEDLGIWNILSQVGDDLIYTKENKLLEFDVLPLNFFDKVINVGLMMLSPPFSYGAIGLVFVGFSSVLYVKRDVVIKRLPESLQKKINGNKTRKKKKNTNGAKRYRRNK